MVDILTFDGISLNPAFHIGGVDVDPFTDLAPSWSTPARLS